MLTMTPPPIFIKGTGRLVDRLPVDLSPLRAKFFTQKGPMLSQKLAGKAELVRFRTWGEKFVTGRRSGGVGVVLIFFGGAAFGAGAG
ncbi:MAG: hypothetical protein ACRECA_08635 [Pseudolabrys sp.]